MLDRVGGLLSEVGRVVRSSHEKWDGTGYPDGLVGEQIPVGSAIVSCCDAFNAMTTDRSYRDAMPLEDAIEELEANSGTQFSPPSSRPCCECSARIRSPQVPGAHGQSRRPDGEAAGVRSKLEYMPKLPRTGGKASTSERAKKPAAKRAAAAAPKEGTRTPSKRTTRAGRDEVAAPRPPKKKPAANGSGNGRAKTKAKAPETDFRHRPVDRHAKHTPAGPKTKLTDDQRVLLGDLFAVVEEHADEVAEPIDRDAVEQRVRVRLRAPRRPAPPVGRGLHHPPGRRGEDLRRACASTPRRCAPRCCTTRSRTRAPTLDEVRERVRRRDRRSSSTASPSSPGSRSRAATRRRPRTTAR